jgi:hypothetical protein
MAGTEGRVARSPGGRLRTMTLHLRLFAIIASQASPIQVQAYDALPVTLSNAKLRVEARSVNGRLVERYEAREGGTWIRIASSAGESEGPVTVRGANGEVLIGALRSISIERGALVERLTVGPHEITRTVELLDGGWVHVATRLEPRGRVELHSVADSFRFEGRPDWSFSPSVGGFNPDAQYKAPLILVQERRRAFGVVPDLAALTRDLIRRCPHSLDLNAPAGPQLSVGFVPARTHFHSVFVEDLDFTWKADQPFVNSYYLLVTATASPGEAFREAVRLHWERFGRQELATAAQEQRGTDSTYKSLGLWEEWRSQVWEKESREQWLAIPLGNETTKKRGARMQRVDSTRKIWN